MSTNLHLIPKEQETEENVSWEDQTRINKFSNLAALNSELEESLKEKNMEKEYLDDLSNELELMDDDDLLRYKIGDSFVSLPLGKVRERLETDSETCNSAVKDLEGRLKEIVDEMSKLKSLLYSKFEPKEMNIIVSNLMETIKSMDKLDRLSIRRTCWETFHDANSRQIIDLCFPAQLGPLCVWPPSKNSRTESKDDTKHHVRAAPESKSVDTLKVEPKSHAIPIRQQEHSNHEIMIKLNSLSEKIDNMSRLLELLLTNTNNGNKHSDS